MATAVAVAVKRARTGPAPYDGLDRMLIAGKWREGTGEGFDEDHDPYTGEVLVRIRHAGDEDLDEAYRAAAAAQRKWGRRWRRNGLTSSGGRPGSWRPAARRSSTGSSASQGARGSRPTSSGRSAAR